MKLVVNLDEDCVKVKMSNEEYRAICEALEFALKSIENGTYIEGLWGPIVENCCHDFKVNR